MPTPARNAREPDEPETPHPPIRPGFRGWEEREEAQLERQGPRNENPEALIAEARVVYLGSGRGKILPLAGALVQYEREDGSIFFVPAPGETEGNLTYDFSRRDRHNRPIKTRLTKEGHPFAICRHIGHLAWFYNKQDADGNPEFQLRAPPALLEKIKAYIERRRAGIVADREHPINVIAAMGNPWGDRGGDIGDRIS